MTEDQAKMTEGKPTTFTNINMPNLSIGLDAIPTYDGTTSIGEFLNIIEDTSTIVNWTEQQKISVTRLKLRFKAKQYIEAEPTLKITTSWDELSTSLRKQFSAHYVAGTAMKQFVECRQRSGETCRQFLTRLKILGHQTFTSTGDAIKDAIIKGNLQSDISTQFSLGLLMPIKQRVLSGNPKTLEDALEIAEREESIENYLRAKDCRAINHHAEKGTRWKKSPSSNKLVCYQCRQPGHFKATCPQNNTDNQYKERQDRSRIICFKCNKKGHYARNCRTRSNMNEENGNSLNGQAASFVPRNLAAAEASWD